jgi:hypothetical protein
MSDLILFDIDELLNIGGQLYTQRVSINLCEGLLAIKGERVLGEPCTQIRIANYIPNSFSWISIRGLVDDIKRQMRLAMSGQLAASGIDGLTPVPRAAVKGQKVAKAATAAGVPKEVLEYIRKVKAKPSDAVPFVPSAA